MARLRIAAQNRQVLDGASGADVVGDLVDFSGERLGTGQAEDVVDAVVLAPRHKSYPNVIRERNDLASMVEITGYRVPENYGTNLVGAALRLLRKQLTDGRKYADLSPAAIRAWRSIVKHNGHDLKGMQHVLRH